MPSSPPEPDEGAPSPRRGLPAAFWIALAFGLVCVFAGLAFARFGPQWFSP